MILKSRSQQLFEDIRDGNVSAVRVAIANGMDVNAPIQYTRSLPLQSSQPSMTSMPTMEYPIHVAAKSHAADVAEIIRMLVAEGADIDVIAGPLTDHTPLIAAAHSGSLQAFHGLLAQGANPYIESASGTNITGISNHKMSGQHEFDLHCEVKKKIASTTFANAPHWRAQFIDEKGRATGRAKSFAYAHALADVFSGPRWKGHEIEALKLYDDLLAAMPEPARAMMRHDVDTSSLSEAAASASEDSGFKRYVRVPPEGRGRQ